MLGVRERPGRQRLSGMDASFLAIESSRVNPFIGSCVVLDPSTAPAGRMDLDTLTQLVEDRLHLIPVFRRRLVEVPLGLGLPYWVDDPDFDLEYHLRESAIPSPGTPKQLADMVARTFARPLDRGRPLWELWLVHGLEHGRVALLTKFHHALIDGVAGNEVLGVLLDTKPTGRKLPAPQERHLPAPLPSSADLVASGLAGVAKDAVKALRTAPRLVPLLPNVPGAAAIPGVPTATRTIARLRGSRSVLELAGARPPATPFNGPLSGHLRWTFGSLPLDRVRAAKAAAGATVNDVIVSLVAGSLRAWLDDHDALPATPLVAAVPISVRADGDDGGNRIGMMTAPIPTDCEDPLERVRRASSSMRGAKDRHGALPAEVLTDVTSFVPPAVAARAARTALNVLSRVQPPVNLLISNVPGPRASLFCAGAEMQGYFPVPPIMDGVALNVTVVSYRDELCIGVLTDRNQIADPRPVLDGLHTALEQLEAVLETQQEVPSP